MIVGAGLKVLSIGIIAGFVAAVDKPEEKDSGGGMPAGMGGMGGGIPGMY